MRNSIFFLCGIVVGALLIQSGVAQDRALRGVNHIGINTRHYEDSLKFYRDTLGAKRHFRFAIPTVRRGSRTCS